MTEKFDITATYAPSDSVVAKEIEGELFLAAITSYDENTADDPYPLNETGRIIWRAVCDRIPLTAMVSTLTETYGVPKDQVESDITGLMRDLLNRNMVIKLGMV